MKLRRTLERQQALFLTERDFYVTLGLTTRKGSELVLLGRRGSCRRISKSVREIILAPVREHCASRTNSFAGWSATAAAPTPICFRARAWSAWDVWGDQVDMFAGGGVS